jgi:dihydroorotase
VGVNQVKLLLKGGFVVDPVREVIDKQDLLVEEGKIAGLAPKISVEDAEIFDVTGCYVCPGFIDLHCHLREPGEEHKETIATGTRAAARGGFTAVVCMGNTNPPADNRAVIEFIKKRAAETGVVPVYPVGCATKGRKGEEISEIGDLVEAGAVALSDDGSSVMNSEVYRRVLEYSKMFDLFVISHCEDKNLSADGVVNEGLVSTILGLKGIPRAAEEVHVARDIILAELTGARLHIAHVSSGGSVRHIKEAKERGLRVTAEVTPHHLCLTEELVKDYDTNAKVNPPLRTREDVEALRQALKQGIIDVIATDHAPHSQEEKEVEFDYAPFGISGLETAVPLLWDKLVHPGFLTPVELVQKLALNPARILGLPERVLAVGKEAAITVIAPDLQKTVDVSSFVSLGKNSPLDGWTLRGWPVLTVVAGKPVMVDRDYFPSRERR